MARTNVTLHKPVRTNTPPSVATLITKQAIDGITGADDGIDCTDFFTGTNNFLIIDNTGAESDITIKASSHYSAIKKGIGDKVITIGASAVYVINQIESARFKDDNDGSIIIEFEAGMTGYVYAVGEERGISS